MAKASATSDTSSSTKVDKAKIQKLMNDKSIRETLDSLTGPGGRLTLRELDYWLHLLIEEEETIIKERWIFQCLGQEGRVALARHIQETFGFVDQRGAKNPFTGEPMPAAVDTIPTGPGPDDKIEVFLSEFKLPGLDAVFNPQEEFQNGKVTFVLYANMKRKHQDDFRALCQAVERRAREDSIFRGRFIQLYVDSDGDIHNPQFLGLPKVEPGDVILPQDTAQVLEHLVYSLFTRTENLRRKGGGLLNRKILLAGPYGCGKSLTLAACARLATGNGWTTIQVEEHNHLEKALSVAKLYQPCLILVEDLDRRLGTDRDDVMNKLINQMDGVLSKSSEVVLMATTNHLDKFQSVSLRPGRTDLALQMPLPDAPTVEALVRVELGHRLAPSQDLSLVGRVLEGRIPAMVSECVKRALQVMVALGREQVTAEDLEVAAHSLYEHMKLLEKEETVTPRDCEVLGKSIEQAAVTLVNGDAEEGRYGETA